ncbi:metallophosphoesterase [Thioclava dalianensis]|uniref:Metallophosphoesterase n=1 Tax=Thioclava dalianensis TaxID=1185766 RepID=A0A074TGM2_9RHOB|nr:UDP-2,3-diacylglucosamine diphosphatase [Thioclava dalianensis]KEP70861.1 metallophosphoesterase [Thioclava dalianensis]SFN12626.1 UDP-2,3-diacylglucosamine pyrophosphatase LpxH [Thioclava dalianensis]
MTALPAVPLKPATRRKQYRALFLSDFHLGSRGCRPGPILEFLRTSDAETIYLVGDILDLWHGGTVQWCDEQTEILCELERRAKAGTRVVYLPGNHDAAMRAPGMSYLNFDLAEQAVHIGADGQRYLVIHGDQCDLRILRWHAMTRFGSRMDALFRGIDAWLRRHSSRGDAEHSAIEQAIDWVNQLISRGDGYERRLVRLARDAKADGIICGHSHKAALRDLDGLTYANCGDWVDSLTALTEDYSGSLQLLEWRVERRVRPAAQPEEPVLAKVRA